MSQQLMQQEWTYQFRPGANPDEAQDPQQDGALSGLASSAQPNYLRRKRLQPTPAVFALLAVCLIVSLLAYVSANAFAARLEYSRQQLLREVESLRSRNAALLCRYGQTQDITQISTFAQAAGMRPADPAAESDFIVFSPSQSVVQSPSRDWFSQGPKLVATFAHQLYASYTDFPVGRAEASAPPAKSIQSNNE